MSIWRDKRGRLHVGLMVKRRRFHRILPPGATENDAKKLEAKARLEIFRVAEVGEAPPVTCLQAVQRYLDEEVEHHKAAHITRLKAYSMEGRLAGRPLVQIHLVAEEMVRELRGSVAAATINRKLSILKRTASLAYKQWGWLTEPLGDRIQKLQGEKARQLYLDQGAIRALVGACQTQVCKDAVVLAAYTGLRTGELYALAPEHYRSGAVYLPDSKSGAPRAVPVIPKIAAAMRRWVRTDKPHPRTVYKDFEAARVKIGMPQLHFHDLRHSCASMLAQAGVDLYTIGQILGHRSTQTTARYAHLAMETKKRALRKIG